MSADEVKFAIDVIDEAFKDPMWIDHNRLASLTMLDLTASECNHLTEYINNKLYNYSSAAITLRNSLKCCK